MLKDFSRKIGLTSTEFNIILFLVGVLALGAIINLFKDSPVSQKLIKFDYTESDSLFDSANPTLKNVEKRVDSKQELLDFSVDKSSRSNGGKQELLENSININTADIQLFIKLPGIGVKTAEKILKLRNERGGFREIEEMLDVKGIGKVKFGNIKKYIYVAK